MTSTFFWLIRACSIIILALGYYGIQHVYENLSPQGCKMSRMTPSYVVQTAFNTSWTPLANRYSLSLYREVGFDPVQPDGLPVLFIPGNAGSSHQVRSIASSATRQYYEKPLSIAPEFSGRKVKPLDFYAVDFNEDLSAFHGPTLDAQTQYTSRAIGYILSLYPQNTSIIVLGHSMGGVVATSLLPSPDVSAIITMSTPHTLPPARFDARIDKIYKHNEQILHSDPTPVLSLCGGATDMMVPSESCVLPLEGMEPGFRRTVFTSALEGAWTGVGHREMVWCHQVRWRVARAALELGSATSETERGKILDEWIRDGHTLPPSIGEATKGAVDPAEVHVLEEGERLLSVFFPRKSALHLIPLPLLPEKPLRATILVGLGSIIPYTSRNLNPLRVSVLLCSRTASAGQKCTTLTPDVVRLLPYAVPGMTFPIPEVGSDESEGVTLFEAIVPDAEEDVEARWLGVRLENGIGRGWIYAGFSEEDVVVNETSTFSLLFGGFTVPFKTADILRIRYSFPHVKSSALLVYRITPARPAQPKWCPDPSIGPLLMHQSQPTETHYYFLNAADRQTLLHTHTPAPYIPLGSANPYRNLEFTLYSSSPLGCNMEGFTISIDWSTTLGRWAARYFITVLSWSIGVISVILFNTWGIGDRGTAIPSVTQSLVAFGNYNLKRLLLLSLVIGTLPVPARYYLGTSGDILFAPLAPLLLLCATGLVSLSWLMLQGLLWPIGKFAALFGGRRRRQDDTGLHRSTVVSIAFILVLIFLLIPWQVAYLGCWTIHCFTCASSARRISQMQNSLGEKSGAVPLLDISTTSTPDNGTRDGEDTLARSSQVALRTQLDNHNYNMHLLLLMTWLLPIVAPVLAVWARTLATAGLSTPFDGDHDFWNITPFVILIDYASRHTGPIFEKNEHLERVLSVRYCWLLVAFTAAFVGPRRTYQVIDTTNIAIAFIVVVRVGRRYWGGRR